ncbi:MAG: ankyrin repeat domain-containing protein [Candidatus Endonucleobacter bathymodioli]|uniref:Ankyrin repeat domain-containing protein n=1 Tax=Candidatus Endonucleibacter bathymodioli TaxID=539814 RepID=A0AA90NZG1_9GAMM|nr:ankyrin repeat domain-containing protein [Candidatus Endonucleobacter bathymodioli]
MFLALHKSLAKPYHLIDLLLFFSIITGVYSGSCCAILEVNPNNHDAPLIDSVDASNNTLQNSDTKHDSSTYNDGSFLDIVQKMDDCALLGAMECLLDIAITNNDAKLMNILQLSKAPQHLSTGNDATALPCTYLNNDYIVKFIRDNIVSHTDTYESGEGLLSVAIPSGNNKLIDLLVESGVNVNSYDNKNNTPLHKAVRCSHLDIVNILLTAGAEVDCLGSHIIPDQDCDVLQKHAYDPGSHISPLQTAILNKNIKIVNALLDSKANPNYYNEGTSTPLLLAIHINSDPDPIVKVLLAAGAAVDELLDSGKYAAYLKARNYTLLHLAVSKGSNELLQFLIQKGANPNEIDEDGNRPLHLAASRLPSTTTNVQNFVSIFESLITAGADVNCKNEKGFTPLLAIASQHYFLSKERSSAIERICSMLLRNGANIDIVDHDTGNTALLYATQNGILCIVDCLLAHGANREIKNHDGLLVSSEDCASLDAVALSISNAPNIPRVPDRMLAYSRNSIRTCIATKWKKECNTSFSDKISSLSLPAIIDKYLKNPIPTSDTD